MTLNFTFVIATHSPYIVKSGINNKMVSIAKMWIAKSGMKDSKLNHTSKLGKVTFAEVNYHAFGILTEELHIELYLALQRKLAPEQWDGTLQKYVGGKPSDLDSVLKKAPYNIPIHVTWTDVNDKKYPTKEETVMTFIRNIIHHGDDAINRGRNRTFTSQELDQSIRKIMSFL